MFDLGESLGNMEQTLVGDSSAASQLQDLQVPAVRPYPTQALVRDLLAQAEVDVGEGGHVLVQHCPQPHVSQVVAPGQVEAGQGVHPRHQLPQGLPDAEDLHLADATLDQ